MPYIEISNTLPGIVGLLAHRPDTAKPLSELAETLLRGPSTLSRGERELIASHVSSLNNCKFCMMSHSAVASHHLGKSILPELQEGITSRAAEIGPKMRTLLHLAGQVQKGGYQVTSRDVAEAKSVGATDAEIHDTVLIAAAFCMYNRYVDGLGTWSMDKPEDYLASGELLATQGYMAALAGKP